MKENNRQLIAKRIIVVLVEIFAVVAFLISLTLCSCLSVLLIYDFELRLFFSGTTPPVYPNATEIVAAKDVYAGNCCIAQIWNYCTDADRDTVISYFEPYLRTFYEDETAFGEEIYVTGTEDDSLLMRFLIFVLDYGNPSLTLTIVDGSPECSSGVWYQIKKHYYSE
jgi:hypothetical protein